MCRKVGESSREGNGIEGMGKGGGRKWRDEGEQQEGSGGKEINKRANKNDIIISIIKMLQ